MISTNLLSKDGILSLFPHAFPLPQADKLLETLVSDTKWESHDFTIFGRIMKMPRLIAWHGDENYSYSGINHKPLAWTPDLLAVKAVAEGLAGVSFNSVLLNFYRDGRDSMSWHADDEPSLGDDPVIASVSLGAERIFRLRHRRDKAARLALSLPHGSCLVMAGEMQRHWLHCLPKTARPVGPRLNLTFRRIISGGGGG